MRPAAEILLMEATALRPILESASADVFHRETLCAGWSVRDVIAHCAAALTRTATGDLHDFSPEANQRDVDERRSLPVELLLGELFDGYAAAATAIDAAEGRLDAIGLGEWVHGGDIRDALGRADAFASPGVELAVPLLVERSIVRHAPRLDVTIDGRVWAFGEGGVVVGGLDTDRPTFVRLTGGRGADTARYRLWGATERDIVLFG